MNCLHFIDEGKEIYVDSFFMKTDNEGMEKELFIKQLRQGIYLLDEAHESTGYLVIGKNKACLIDTMNGYTNLKEVVSKLTDRELLVVNTHGHPDHIFGNVFFDEVYMNPSDYELAATFTDNPEFNKEGLHFPPYKPIQEGDVLDLGGRNLEIYNLPGHTRGGILLLLKEERLLFTGDSINHHLWMQLDGCPPMEELVKNLDRIMFLEKEADFILHGHARDFDDISLLPCMRQGALEIAQGKTEEDEDYHWFGGIGKQHHFKLNPDKHYSQLHSVICYTPKENDKS